MEVEVAMFQHVCLHCAQCGRVAHASCAPRPVVPWWCAHIPCAGAPRPRHSATRPVPLGTRSWVPSHPPWSDMATFSGPRSTPFSATFPANLGHVPRLSRPLAEAGAKCSMTLKPCSHSLSHVPIFLASLSECPPSARISLAHVCARWLCARRVSRPRARSSYVRAMLCACSSCARAMLRAHVLMTHPWAHM
ncbi:Zinc finger, C2H [Parasponia andersonii]|uniref:Zinc finger, C2H n=1 Tax=Parasponia andersonii TaxID=3476 RepID=A0A2P5DW21_PARAD|nr:Zinc finger, C2H [Parasponia andersonii]